MLLENLSKGHLWLIGLCLVLVHLLHNKFQRGLNKYPGPFFAAYTNWWRFIDVFRRRPDITHRRLHADHGDIVRLGPSYLSFASPQAMKDIYGHKSGVVKSEFYPVQQAVSNGHRLPSLFSTTDEAFHARLRRTVNHAFSLSALLQYEQFVDSTSSEFLRQLKSRFCGKPGSEGVFDLARWLQYYAFDVIGELTYGKRHGFIDRGIDVDGIIEYLAGLFDYVAPIGQMPFLDSLWLKNPVLSYLNQLKIIDTSFPVAKFAKTHMDERIAEMETEAETETASTRVDLLTKFLEAGDKYPDVMDQQRVLTMAVSMAFAGSETTAISLSAVFYYLLKNRRCYDRLMQELNQAESDGLFDGHEVVTWVAAQKLPYLDACIKEAFRLHPAAGLPLERVVPPQGIHINNEFVPGGTIVGCNAWVIHRRPEIFGYDVDAYRPERWIDSPEEQIKTMNANMFQFGAGGRTCIGKNISLLEIYKIVPSLLRQFNFELADPEREWTLRNSWFVRQLGFKVRIAVRGQGGDHAMSSA